MSLLSVIQPAALRFGFGAPSVAASSTDQSIVQMVAFANEEGQELAAAYPWQNIRFEANFTTLATESQGNIKTICLAAQPQYPYEYIYNETIWNRTQKRPVFGPKSPAEWQQLKAQFVVGPWSQFILRGDNILFIPAPPAGQSCYFEYVSKNWCTNAAGSVGKSSFTADDDVSLINERLITLGVVWRFQQAKGLDYSASYDKYQSAIIDAKAREGGKATLNLSGSQMEVQPGVWVSAGNWTL